MMRSTKAWLTIGVLLVLIGAGAVCCSMAINGWKLPGSGSREFETRVCDIAEDFGSIIIGADAEDIELVPSQDGKCTVEFYESKQNKLSASAQDGTLRIEEHGKVNWWDNIGFFSFGRSKVTIRLPEAEYDSLTIEGATGDIVIPAGFTFTKLTIAAETGDVDCRASAGTLSIDTSTGDVRVEGMTAEEMTVVVSTGRVEIANVTCTGVLGLTVSTGRAALTDVRCGSFASTGSTGDITLKNVTADGLINIERSTGDVKFEGCDAAELEIETNTGSVTGTLLTSKVFIVKSDTGRITVPESVTGGKCKVTTDTGDVRMEVGNG